MELRVDFNMIELLQYCCGFVVLTELQNVDQLEKSAVKI